jgi:hypothetical protein
MMTTAKITPFLWEYVMQTAVMLLNYFPTQALNMLSTPHLEVFGAAPDVSHIRTLGCDVYVGIPEHQQSVLGHRSWKGTLVGYDYSPVRSSLAYLWYHPSRRAVYKSGHVQFNEDISISQYTHAQQYEIDQVISDLTREDPIQTMQLPNPKDQDDKVTTETTNEVGQVTLPRSEEHGSIPAAVEDIDVEQDVPNVTIPVESTEVEPPIQVAVDAQTIEDLPSWIQQKVGGGRLRKPPQRMNIGTTSSQAYSSMKSSEYIQALMSGKWIEESTIPQAFENPFVFGSSNKRNRNGKLTNKRIIQAISDEVASEKQNRATSWHAVKAAIDNGIHN